VWLFGLECEAAFIRLRAGLGKGGQHSLFATAEGELFSIENASVPRHREQVTTARELAHDRPGVSVRQQVSHVVDPDLYSVFSDVHDDLGL
jgi:hypothetical protein